MALASDLARALDPTVLAAALGMDSDPWQAEVLRSTDLRVLLNCCRQSGKSTTSAVKAVHVAVYEPGALILLLSPSQRQSAELFRKVVATYKALGRPVRADTESATTLTLENGSRVVSLPGSEGTVRGYSGVRLLIVDEASRVDDELLASVRPMLAVSGGQFIALSTPCGMRGWWYEAWEHGGPAWRRVRVTADECPRIGAAFLAEERVTLGDWLYRQEYMCEFAETSAQMFSEEAIRAMLDAAVAPWAPTKGAPWPATASAST